jgi:uncharacterized protein YcnI
MTKIVRTLCVLALGTIGALAVASAASAHARVSPAVVVTKVGQDFSLDVPTEKENATTTTVEFTVPSGFSIDSFVPSPGWKRSVQSTGTGDNTIIQKVTWSGGSVPTGEDASFHFLAIAASAKTYTFGVRQTYSDGSVVDWNGPETADTPSATIEAVSSLGSSSTSTWAYVALGVAIVALLLALGGLLAGRGRSVA